MGKRLLRFTIRCTAYSSYAVELKLGRMILDISPHNLAKEDFSISSEEVLWGARLLRSSIRFAAHSSYAIEVKLSRMILEINPIASSRIFRFPPKALLGRAF